MSECRADFACWFFVIPGDVFQGLRVHLLFSLCKWSIARVYLSINIYKLASFDGGVIVSVANFSDLGGYFDDNPPSNGLSLAVEAGLSVDCQKNC